MSWGGAESPEPGRDETRAEMQLLLLRTLQITKEGQGNQLAAFRQALDERLSVRLRHENGRFIYACFHSTTKQKRDERIDPGYTLIDAVLAFVRRHPVSLPKTEEWAEIISLSGVMHVHVVMSIEDLASRKVGFVQAIYAPSEAALKAIQKTLERSIILASSAVKAGIDKPAIFMPETNGEPLIQCLTECCKLVALTFFGDLQGSQEKELHFGTGFVYDQALEILLLHDIDNCSCGEADDGGHHGKSYKEGAIDKGLEGYGTRDGHFLSCQ